LPGELRMHGPPDDGAGEVFDLGRRGEGACEDEQRDTPRDERRYLPLTDEVVTAHLEGRETIGLYPLLTDDSCELFACDFDRTSWQLDVRAYVEVAQMVGLPTAVEISRSGDGAHVWIFFTARVAAADARAMGAGSPQSQALGV